MYYCVSPWVVIIYRFYVYTVHQIIQCVPWVVIIYRFYVYTVHQIIQCVPWVVIIYRFYCTSTNTMCPLGGLYIQVRLYINQYNVSLGCSLYASSTVHQLIQCVPWVVFIIHTSSTEHQLINPLHVPLSGLYYMYRFNHTYLLILFSVCDRTVSLISTITV